MAFDAFDEFCGSPTFDIAPDGRRAMRTAKIPWSRVDEFIEFIFPTSGLSPPRQYPNTPSLLSRSMHIEPFIGDKTVVTSPGLSNLDYDTPNLYEFARVRIDYETPQFSGQQEAGGDPVLFLSHRWSIGGEFLLMDSQGLEWATGTTKFVDENVKAGMLIPMEEHQITWPRVVNPPFAAMRSLLGAVNSGPFTFKTGTAATETLLFLGAELRRDILSSGALAWEVTYRFSERAVPSAEAGETTGGWNHFFRSEDADNNARVEGLTGFYRLRKKSDSSPIYRLGNFLLLFQGA